MMICERPSGSSSRHRSSAGRLSGPRHRARRSCLCLAASLLGALCAAVASAEQSRGLFASLISGTYRDEQTLGLESLEPGAALTYAFVAADGSISAPQGYRAPLRLSAARGEERSYRLLVTLWKGAQALESRELAILIDRRPPRPPLADPPGGIQEGRVEVRFSTEEGTAVYYTVNGNLLTEPLRWDGRPFVVDVSRGEQVLRAYALDAAGNRSEVVTQLYTGAASERSGAARLDIVSPAEGSFANRQLLYIVSENVGRIRYTLDGTDPTRGGSEYTEPRLLDVSGHLRLRVAAYPAGADREPLLDERSFEVVPEKEQSLAVGAPSGVYSADRTVEVLGAGGVVFYTAGDEKPDDYGMVYTSPLALRSTPGARRSYVLRFRLLRVDGSWGGEYRCCYVLDRRIPAAPDIQVSGRQPARSSVTVRVAGLPGTTIRYTLDGSEPGPSSPVYTAPLEVAPARSGRLTVKAVASAPGGGAATSAAASRTVLFDTTPPAPPRVEASELLARKAVRIAVSTEEDASPVYEVAYGGSEPAVPGAGSPASDPSFLLDVPEGARGVFSLRFAAVDAAGNVSAPSQTLRVVVDREPPALPAALARLDGARLEAPFAFEPGAETPLIRYEVREDGNVPPDPSAASPTAAAGGGKPLSLPGQAGKLTLYALKLVLVDELGNASEPYGPFSVSVDLRGAAGAAAGGGRAAAPAASAAIRTSILPPAAIQRLPPPAVRGVEDGGIYRTDRTLVAEAPGGVVRYEMTLDGTTPAEVTPSSPIVSAPLELSVLDGATVEIAVRLRAYPDGVAAAASEETRLLVRIDKTPPDPPVATGITDGGFYRDRVTVGLLASEGTVYCGVESEGLPAIIPAAIESNRYREPFLLQAGEGEVASYRIVAYTVDEAQNRSRRVRTWTVTLDNKVLYVSEKGDDGGPGTRDRPLRTLRAAVSAAGSGPRREVRVALGTHTLEQTLELPPGLSLVGGLSENWEPAGLGRKTTVTAGERFPAGAPLLRASGGTVRLEGLRLTHPADAVPTLLSVEGAELRLESCEAHLTRGEERAAIHARGGTVTLASCEMESEDGATGSFIRAGGASIALTGTNLRGPRSSTSFAAVLLGEGSTASFLATRIDPGGGQRTDGIRAEGSTLSILRSSVESGAAGTLGVALRCSGSRVEVADSLLAGSPGGLYTFALFAEASTVSVGASRMTAAARAGATGLKARGGELVVERSELRASDTKEFAYLVDLDGALGRLSTNVMAGARSGDSIVALLAGGSTDWLSNTIVAGTGTGLTTGFYMSGGGSHRIVNNILTRREPDTGTAILRIGDPPGSLTLVTNNLSGWTRLLGADGARGRGPGTVTDIDALELADGVRPGGPIALNIREPFLRTFVVSKTEDYHLAATSLCVDRGTATDRDPYRGPALDMDGERRPSPAAAGATAAWDIGADERY